MECMSRQITQSLRKLNLTNQIYKQVAGKQNTNVLMNAPSTSGKKNKLLDGKICKIILVWLFLYLKSSWIKENFS